MEHLIDYAQSDLVMPSAPLGDLTVANDAAWCGAPEVNARGALGSLRGSPADAEHRRLKMGSQPRGWGLLVGHQRGRNLAVANGSDLRCPGDEAGYPHKPTPTDCYGELAE